MRIVDNPNQINIEKWKEFVNSHPNGSIFQTPEIFNIYQKSDLYEPIVFFAIDNSDSIVGILQTIIHREHKGVLGFFSSRAIIWGGPIVEKNDTDIADVLLETFNKKIKKKAIYSQFRNIFDTINYKHCFNKFGYKFEDHLDIINFLGDNEKDIFEKIQSTRRRQIIRAQKRGCEVSLVNDFNQEVIEETYSILKTLYSKIRLPLPSIDLFLNACKVLSKQGNIKLFVAKYNSEIIACRYVLTFEKTIYDWYSASKVEHHDKYANDLLPWEVFKWGSLNNYMYFDFMGAGKPNIPYGVRDYKLKFGGELVNFGRYEKIHKPVLFQIGKIGLKLWKLLK